MTLAAVRSIASAGERLRTAQDVEDFEQEIVDQYALAMAAAGLTDAHVSQTRAVVIEFARFLGRPLWEASCEDADRFLAEQRRLGLAVSTRAGKAGTLARLLRVHGLPLSGADPPADRCRGRAADRRVQPPVGQLPGPGAGAAVARRRSTRCSAQWRAVDPGGAQVPAGGAGLLRGVAVAPARAADQRDGDARHPRLAPGPGRVRQAARPARQGQPGPRTEGPAGAGDQRRGRADRLVAGRGAPPVRRGLVGPGRADAAQRAARPRTWRGAAGWARTRCAAAWPSRRSGGCRRGRGG